MYINPKISLKYERYEDKFYHRHNVGVGRIADSTKWPQRALYEVKHAESY